MTILTVNRVRKSYGATIALRSVSLEVLPGQVHAVLGENGAGKSSLVKMLSGIIRPDAGDIQLCGAPFSPCSLMEARRAGVSTAFQELSLLPNLTVAENLSLPHPIKGRLNLTSTAKNHDHARDLLARYRIFDVSPSDLVGDLSLAQRQRVEIVRAISQDPRLLILDEPTAALPEPDWLFEIVDGLTDQGISALYISHRMSEVRRLCKFGTVLRNGESIGTVELAATSDADVFQMMVGSHGEGGRHGHASTLAASAREAVRVEKLGGTTIHDVDLTIRASEIVGVAALEGQGQRELFRILGGLERPRSGTIFIDGEAVSLTSPAQALKAQSGIAFVPEERKSEGIFLTQLTRSNVTMPIMQRFSRIGLINPRAENAIATDEVQQVQLAPRYLSMPISALSGGNQQKALIMRVLLSGARNLVLYDPTRGVDVGTKQVIYDVIRRFAEGGGSVLIYSTELPELVDVTHRTVVLYRGRIAGELAGAALKEDGLVALATGHGGHKVKELEPA